MPRYSESRAALWRQAAPAGRYRYVRRQWHIWFAAIDLVGGLLFGAAQRVRRGVLHFLPSAQRDGSSPIRRILLVQLDHLGDAIISTALLPALKRTYPAAELHVLASPRAAEVFCRLPLVDRVHLCRDYRFDARPWRRWLPATLLWALRLRRWRFDLGFDVRGELPLAALLWLAGVRRRIGWASGGGGFLLTASGQPQAGRHELAARRELLRAAGVDAATREIALPNWPDEAWADRLVTSRMTAIADGDAPLVVLHLGAGTAAKRWPLEHWRTLVTRLLSQSSAALVLVGGNDDVERSRLAAQGYDSHRVLDLTGQLALVELAALCRRAALFVGADSGPAHLAAAVGTEVLALFSGTNDSRQWRPAGKDVTVLRHEVACSPCHRHDCAWSDHPCMDGLAPGRVVAAALELLSRRTAAALAEPADPGRSPLVT